MVLLPNLSTLSINEPFSVLADVETRWRNACGKRRPNFKSWKRLSGSEKMRLLHLIAAEADDDEIANGDYTTPYDELDIDDVLKTRVWSVEHVVPRSHVHDRKGGAANDPLGWITATRTANSRRSNYPLMLWPDQVDGKFAIPGTLVRFEGELHFVPPANQRARLARKWLYIRATYAGDLTPPSRAQVKYAAEIVAWAKTFPVQKAEQRVNNILEETFQWSNPLLKEWKNQFYDDVEWRSLVFS